MPRTTRKVLQPIFYSDPCSIPDSQPDTSINSIHSTSDSYIHSSIHSTIDSHMHSINIRIFRIQARINALYVRSLGRLCYGVTASSTNSSCESSRSQSPMAPPASPVSPNPRSRCSATGDVDSLDSLHLGDHVHWPFQPPSKDHKPHLVAVDDSDYYSSSSQDEVFWDAEEVSSLEGQSCKTS